MKVVYYFIFLLIPLSAANQSDSLRNVRTLENIEHYKKLVIQTRHEVDSLLNRLPNLISSDKSTKKSARKIKRAVKHVKRANVAIKELSFETGIPDSSFTPDMEIICDTVDIIIPEIKDYKIPLFKRIFKQRKNKKK